MQTLVSRRRGPDEGDGWGRPLGVEAVHSLWDCRNQEARRE